MLAYNKCSWSVGEIYRHLGDMLCMFITVTCGTPWDYHVCVSYSLHLVHLNSLTGQTTVLNKSFATLHICLIFGSLSYANNFKVNIGKNTNHLHKQSNIFGKIMLIRYCFIAKTIHPGCITKSAQNQHIHKYESNNTPYLFDHTVVFV